MSAQVIRFPAERRAPKARRPRARELGISPRQLGISPRQLEGLTDQERAARFAQAASVVRRQVPGPVAPPARPLPRPTVEHRRSAGMSACSACGGTGWVDTAGNAVEPCECREGVIL